MLSILSQMTIPSKKKDVKVGIRSMKQITLGGHMDEDEEETFSDGLDDFEDSFADAMDPTDEEDG